MADTKREARLRAIAYRRNLSLRKSKLRDDSELRLDDRGGYKLVDMAEEEAVAGECFDLTLDQVETWLR